MVICYSAFFIRFVTAIAEVYKNEGDEEDRKGDFSNAIYFYTEGIKVKCKDDELNARLHGSKADVYLFSVR